MRTLSSLRALRLLVLALVLGVQAISVLAASGCMLAAGAAAGAGAGYIAGREGAEDEVDDPDFDDFD